MKKKVFVSILTGSVVLTIISIVAQSVAAGGFVFSLIMMIEYWYALKSSERLFGVYNPMKHYYHRRGRPDKYKKLTGILSIVFFFLGLYSLVADMFI